MALHPAAEIKEALRTTMKKVEDSFASEAENSDLAELKHIVVQRIASLEEAEHAEPSTD